MMATPTYDLIEEQVLGSAQATVTFGNGGTLTQAYKDLVLEFVSGMSTPAAQSMRINGDTGTNYSETILVGNGSAASSPRHDTWNRFDLYWFGYGGSLSNPNFGRYEFLNYASTSIYKTGLARQSVADSDTSARVILWRSTAAITSLTLFTSSNTYIAGSTFRLWGVKG